jgi:hypothetical protein
LNDSGVEVEHVREDEMQTAIVRRPQALSAWAAGSSRRGRCLDGRKMRGAILGIGPGTPLLTDHPIDTGVGVAECIHIGEAEIA